MMPTRPSSGLAGPRRRRPHGRWGALGGWGLGLLLSVSFGLTAPPAAIAHGAILSYRLTPSVEIQAQFDTGAPMDAAQVLVYAPDQPQEPWLQGITDRHGRFTFQPDYKQSGTWEVVVRQAGHGSILQVPLSANAIGQVGSSQRLPPWLRLGLSGLVVAGLVGLAWVFARRPQRSQP